MNQTEWRKYKKSIDYKQLIMKKPVFKPRKKPVFKAGKEDG